MPVVSSRLVGALRRWCRNRGLDETWLLAPTLATARQWVEAVARQGTPVLNVRPFTPKRLALHVAAVDLARQGRRLVPRTEALFLVERLWNAAVAAGRLAYLGNLAGSPGVARALLHTFEDLRRAGLGPGDLHLAGFEAPEKGRELVGLFSDYLDELHDADTVDYAGLLEAAIHALAAGTFVVPTDVAVLVPADLRLTAMERSFLDALPHDRIHPVAVDRPLGRSTKKLDTGSVTVVRAVGPSNEVRHVLRTCLVNRWPLDQVEVLYTRHDPYAPLVAEALSACLPDAEPPPATFAEGLPARLTRPGRALHGWLAWMASQYDQRVLAPLLADGLVRRGDEGLARALETVPVGRGRDRYLPLINGAIQGATDPADLVDADEPPPVADREALVGLRDLVAGLLALEPDLAGARTFLTDHADVAGPVDVAARDDLVRTIDAVVAMLDEHSPVPFDGCLWLADQLAGATVRRSGPRPGALHCSPLSTGGHTGRPHTFVLGLDDTSFPGAGLPDPLLLDGERRALSPALPTAATRVEDRLADVHGLVTRLRGTLCLTYPSRSLDDGRELYPATVLVAIHRICSGNPEADQAALLQALAPPTSFAPVDTYTAPPSYLDRGRAARAAWASTSCTCWDGAGPGSRPPNSAACCTRPSAAS